MCALSRRQREDALLLLIHHATAALEFVHKGIDQLTVTGAGFGQLCLDALIGCKFGFTGGEAVEHGLERCLGFSSSPAVGVGSTCPGSGSLQPGKFLEGVLVLG